MNCSIPFKTALTKLFKQDEVNLSEGINAIKSWTNNSEDIVKSYIEKGEHKALDSFFLNVKPLHKDLTTRVGMIDKDTVRKLKVGDYTENPFPFASSKNPEDNVVFHNIAKNRLKDYPDKREVLYSIDNSNVPQYDIQKFNPVETEVLIKPKTIFTVEHIKETDDLVEIFLHSPKRQDKARYENTLIPLLGVSGLSVIDEEAIK